MPLPRYNHLLCHACMLLAFIPCNAAAQIQSAEGKVPQATDNRFKCLADIFGRPALPSIKGKSWVAVDRGPANWPFELNGWMIEDAAKEILIVDWYGESHRLRKPAADEKRPRINEEDGGFLFSTIRDADRSAAWKVEAEDYNAKSKKFLADGLPNDKDGSDIYDSVRQRFGLADHIVDSARYAHFAFQFAHREHAEQLYAHTLEGYKKYSERYFVAIQDPPKNLQTFVADRIVSGSKNAAVHAAHGGTPRKDLQEQWERIAAIPHHQYREQAKEMANYYRSLLEEDARWTEPDAETFANMNSDQKIAYWLYHLRDLDVGQWSDPGSCHVLGSFSFGNRDESKPNAAIELRKFGMVAVPHLISHLDDARPTRCKGHWRSYWPELHHLLRYQDAAIQILNDLLPAPFYHGSSADYFSNESPEVRERTISSIKSWYKESKGKSELEAKWLATDEMLGIYPLLALLEELAFEDDQKHRVRKILTRLCDERDPLQLPQLSNLLCQLGDLSQLKAVASAYLAGQYDVTKSLPDDSCPGSNAQDYALRQLILYGDESHRLSLKIKFKRNEESLSMESAVFSMLVDLALGEFERLPKTYDKSRFPLDLLVEALKLTDVWGSAASGDESWTIRRCDKAAEAIQKFSATDFGYDERASVEEKDRAVSRIVEWWKERPSKLFKGREAEQCVGE